VCLRISFTDVTGPGDINYSVIIQVHKIYTVKQDVRGVEQQEQIFGDKERSQTFEPAAPCVQCLKQNLARLTKLIRRNYRMEDCLIQKEIIAWTWRTDEV
jgi:hypothetical protein